MTVMAQKRMRTCIGCSQQFPKEQLKRIVRTPSGSIEFDGTGRASGRGAYVCSMACLAEALKARRLQRSLKTAISQDEADAIVGHMLDAFGDDVR